MAQDPQKINVVVSGATSTQVKVPTSSNQITVSQQPTTATVSSAAQESNINVGFLGVQGIPGTLTISPGEESTFLYNRVGYVSGTASFFYYPAGTKLNIIDKDLVLGDGAAFVLSGMPLDENAFLLKDANNKNLIRVDTKNTGIHLTNGNVFIDGNLIPAESGVYSLGSPTKPFKDVYLQGDSVYFIDEGAQIKATSSGFTFQISGEGEEPRELLQITEESAPLLSGIIGGDGAGLTGIPYTGLTDAGAYVAQSVSSGVSSTLVDYKKTLTYNPAVICALHPPTGAQNPHRDEYYFTVVRDITKTGCRAVFSSEIQGSGYYLQCHISPKLQ